MITEDLIAYIQAQTRKKVSKNIIISRLEGAGWRDSDIDEAFNKLTPPPISKPAISPIVREPLKDVPKIEQKIEQKPDPYREIPSIEKVEDTSPKSVFVSIPISKPKPPSPLTPIMEVKKEPEIKKPVFSTSFKEANTGPSYYIPDNSVFNPQNHSKNTTTKPQIDKTEPKSDVSLNFQIMRPKMIEVPASQMANPISNITDFKSIKPIPITPAEPLSKETTQEIDMEFMPKLAPKNPQPHSAGVFSIKDPYAKPEIKIENKKEVTQEKTLDLLTKVNQNKVAPSKFIPVSAILHSYPQVLLASNPNNEKIFTKKRPPIKLVVTILLVSLVLGVIVAVSFKYVKLPSFSFNFIKKDPKSLLLNGPTALSSLKSYKIETKATLSTTSFADITSSLVSGEAASSRERDFVTLVAKGIVNNTGKPVPIYDYQTTFKSSMFKTDIVSDIKFDDITYISIPDLSQLLEKNAPQEGIIAIDKNGYSFITSFFSKNLEPKISKVDINKVISTALPSYITTETATVFADFIGSASVLEKPEEEINGIPSYHYAISADRLSSKKFLTQFVSVFLNHLTDSEKSSLSESLGSTTIDGFEIWIGKEDRNVHRYKFSLTAPLSKIIGLEDKGIAGNTVTLDWQTTYYDFDVPNNIEMPKDAISMSDFMKDTTDKKIENLITDFKPAAQSLKNAIGNYGRRSNPTGSCVNPNPTSLFSPVGHPKAATTAIGDISSLMNEILSTTNGAMTCYSTSGEWAISAPLASEPTSSFCSDSSGKSIKLTTQLKGTACK